ncbi:ribosome hibernation-promoting factor, HPF/YfiA family [Haliangium sp.]|uniref:ribosome hibernation-promoting factor, HPF/YfiA family n=1 Tax=Haliangium sp. TaxID=2663208 RepID=UPI003D0AE869
MQFSVTFRHMEATEALKEYARERMERIRKYFPDPIAVHVVMSTERGYNHRVDVTMQLHNGLTVAGREASESMYSSIDLVTAKIEKQVRRYKDKLRTHKSKTHLSPLPWSHTVVSDPEPEGEDEVESEAAAEFEAAAPGSVPELAVPPVVVKTEKFHANPMSVSEAIMQLNLLHEQFLVFRHDETGRVNVVYRRDDDSYGLIEASPAEAAPPS